MHRGAVGRGDRHDGDVPDPGATSGPLRRRQPGARERHAISVTKSARVDVSANTAEGHDPVSGHGPSGDIAAQGFRVLDKGNTIIFTGTSNLLLKGNQAERRAGHQAPDAARRGSRDRGADRGRRARATAGADAAKAGRGRSRLQTEATPKLRRPPGARRQTADPSRTVPSRGEARCELNLAAPVRFWLRSFAAGRGMSARSRRAAGLRLVRRAACGGARLEPRQCIGGPADRDLGRFRDRVAAGRASLHRPRQCRGQARDHRGPCRHADRALPPSKGAGGENEIYRVNADGHVTIKGERQTVVGDQAVYDVDQQIGIVTGKGLKLTTATDVVTARDSLEWYDQKQIAVARGDAVAVRETKRIRADVLTAHMTKDNPKPAASKPETGPVRAGAGGRNQARAKPGAPARAARRATKDRRSAASTRRAMSSSRPTTDIGRGDYGVYNADTGIATLLGNVTVTRGSECHQRSIRGHRPQQQHQPHDAGARRAGKPSTAGRGSVRPSGQGNAARELRRDRDPGRRNSGHRRPTAQKP